MNARGSRGRTRELRWLLGALISAGVLIGGALLLIWLIRWVIPFAEAPQLWSLTPEERAAVTGVRLQAMVILVQVLGGVFLVGTFIFSLFAVINTRDELRVSQEGQITERFTRAIEQFASDDPTLHIGGIHALERIAWDSPRDYWTVIEILTSYVRRNYPAPSLASEPEQPLPRTMPGPEALRDERSFVPRSDVQAIINVIGRRPKKLRAMEPSPIDLSYTDLRGIQFRDGIFERINFRFARLDHADFTGANLKHSTLQHANLFEAFLSDAKLQCAILDDARLSKTNLYRAVLTDTSACFTDLSTAWHMTQHQLDQLAPLTSVCHAGAKWPEKDHHGHPLSPPERPTSEDWGEQLRRRCESGIRYPKG